MAATIAASRYFNTIRSLRLTTEQEQELESYMPMVKRICRKHVRHDKLGRFGDDPLISAEDLMQMALVRLTIAIREGKADNARNTEAYYAKIIKRSCLTQLECNRIRGDKRRHRHVDEIDEQGRLIDARHDVDRHHDRLYIEQLLSHLGGKYNKDILMHYYGIETSPIDPACIADLIPMEAQSIAKHRYRSLGSLRKRINEGALPAYGTR